MINYESLKIFINFYQMNQSRMVVRRRVGLNKALTLPRGAPDGPSTTKRPNSIGRPLSFAICSKVINALSSLPLDV